MATSSGSMTVKLIGDEELKRKLRSSRADKPVARFLDRSATFLQGQARKHAPKDTGRLTNSIGTESLNSRLRSVGTNLDYAEPIEKGTRPHYPPLGALEGWAKRHGMDARSLQQAIGRRGTKAQPYLQPAADETEVFVETLVPVLAAEIESAFQ